MRVGSRSPKRSSDAWIDFDLFGHQIVAHLYPAAEPALPPRRLVPFVWACTQGMRGLIALLTAHRALEEAVLSKQQNRFKPEVARKWVELVYEGFYHDPLKTDLEAFLASTQKQVNGDVLLETGGARVDAVQVESPHILASSGATYAQSADWGVEEAEGFIKLFGMSSTLWAEVNSES